MAEPGFRYEGGEKSMFTKVMEHQDMLGLTIALMTNYQNIFLELQKNVTFPLT